MSNKYVTVSGVLFGLVALAQLARALNQWPVQIGNLDVPVWASWIAATMAAGLCGWAFRSRKR